LFDGRGRLSAADITTEGRLPKNYKLRSLEKTERSLVRTCKKRNLNLRIDIPRITSNVPLAFDKWKHFKHGGKFQLIGKAHELFSDIDDGELKPEAIHHKFDPADYVDIDFPPTEVDGSEEEEEDEEDETKDTWSDDFLVLGGIVIASAVLIWVALKLT